MGMGDVVQVAYVEFTPSGGSWEMAYAIVYKVGFAGDGSDLPQASGVWIVPSSQVMEAARRGENPFPDHAQIVCIDSPESDFEPQPECFGEECISWVSTPGTTSPAEKGAFLRISAFARWFPRGSRLRKIGKLQSNKDKLLLVEVFSEEIWRSRENFKADYGEAVPGRQQSESEKHD